MTLLFIYKHVPVLFFVVALGAIVGSFLNVVVYRLPHGMSVIAPPSRCPTCGARLRWWENLPILGWFVVRGRCRHCGVKISPQYMIVELLMALLFGGLYVAYYMVDTSHHTWWGAVGGPWWYDQEVWRTAPMFISYLVLLSGLAAMTLIDARTFTIPIQIPVLIVVVAFIAAPLQGFLVTVLPPVHGAIGTWPYPVTDWQWFAVVVGGMIGIACSMVLLRLGIFQYSFSDYDDYVTEGEVLAEYPHARREMFWELAFLVPCVAGLVGGWFVGRSLSPIPPPVAIQSLGGAIAGYLVGGGLVWAVRILGTLGFGKEAMGAGDIHLVAAVGAALGCWAPLWVFFVAPFSGLLWVAVSKGVLSMFARARRELPYGPHLAVATVIVIACEPAFDWIQAQYLQALLP